MAEVLGIFVLAAAVLIPLITYRITKPRLESTSNFDRPANQTLVEITRLIEAALPPSPPESGASKKLWEGNQHGALALAEKAISESPEQPESHLQLAGVLIQLAQFHAASQVLRNAPPSSARNCLEQTVKYLAYESQLSAEEQPPPLLSPAEVFFLQVSGQSDELTNWLTRSADVEIGPTELNESIESHQKLYREAFDVLCKTALEGGVTEAYHVARLAIKLGYIETGTRLFLSLEGSIEMTKERFRYRSDKHWMQESRKDPQIG